MASTAEQLAANLNFGAMGKAAELKKRIWFTLEHGVVIIIVGSHSNIKTDTYL